MTQQNEIDESANLFRMGEEYTEERIDNAIAACKELEGSKVYGAEVKRVCKNTREMLQMGRPRKNPVTRDDQGRETVEVIARQQGNTGAALIPKDWIGHRCLVIRLD